MCKINNAEMARPLPMVNESMVRLKSCSDMSWMRDANERFANRAMLMDAK